jgi:hypothetical protein
MKTRNENIDEKAAQIQLCRQTALFKEKQTLVDNRRVR